MTPKDRADLEAALVTGVDWVALSFVQRAEDVNEAKKLIRGRAAVMAKIEKPQAIDRLAEILEASDALMVARGESRRRIAAGAGAEPAEADDAAGAPRRQAGGGRYPNAGIDDPKPGADARRSLRRRDRGLRGRRRHHALGGIRRRQVSGRSSFNDESHRRGSGARPDLSRRPDRATISAGSNRRRRHRGRCAPDRRNAGTVRDHLLDQFGIDRDPRRARTARNLRWSRFTPNLATGRKLSLVWGVHCVVAEDAHDQDDIGRPRGQPSRFATALRRPASASSSSPDVPLGTPGATNMLRIAMSGRPTRMGEGSSSLRANGSARSAAR